MAMASSMPLTMMGSSSKARAMMPPSSEARIPSQSMMMKPKAP